MEKKPLETSYESGLELDEIELPAGTPEGTARKSTAESDRESTPSSNTGSSRRRHLRLTLTAVIATLALLTALGIYLKKQSLKVSFLGLKNTSVSNSYLRVGPITATIKNSEVIQLSLEIECENDTVKEKLAEKDSRIRDKIVSVITAPDTETLLKNHQYDAVRAKIRDSLEKVYGESIGEVYFAELLTY